MNEFVLLVIYLNLLGENQVLEERIIGFILIFGTLEYGVRSVCTANIQGIPKNANM